MSPLKAHDLERVPWHPDIVVFWGGTRASIPAPFAAVSAMENDRFLKGHATSVGTLGGALTHAHELAAHSGHSVSTNSDHSQTDVDSNVGAIDVHYYQWLGEPTGHAHNLGSGSETIPAANNLPSYLYVIPIANSSVAGGTGKGLPRPHDLKASALPPYKCVVGFKGVGALPPGWYLLDGTTQRGVALPNVNNGQFVKAHTAAGAGGAGVAGHVHSLDHAHGASTGASTSQSREAGPDDDDLCATKNHAHTLGNQALNSGAATNTEPLSYTIRFATFLGFGTGGTESDTAILTEGDLDTALIAPRGLITLGLDVPPTGWQHCDNQPWANGAPAGYGANRPNAQGRLLRMVPNAGADGGGVGGSDTHEHDVLVHTHTLSGVTGQGSANNDIFTGGYSAIAGWLHQHTSGAVTMNNGAAGGKSTQASSILPPHYQLPHWVRD